jgi:hypothetical protein
MQENENISPAQPVIPKRKSRWWIWLFWLIAAVLFGLYWIYEVVSIPSDTIIGQLYAIRDGKLTEAYYDYTSKDFQSKTSLEQFKTFIKHNDVFEGVKTFLIEDESGNASLEVVKGYIISETGASLEVEYRFVLEEGDWKIFSLSPIERGVEENIPQSSLTKQMLEPIQIFLENVKSPNFATIYPTLVSRDFETKLPYSEFQKLLEKNPLLAHFTDFDLVDHTMEQGIGYVMITLNPQKEAVPINITMVKENGQWKIFRFSMGEFDKEELLKTKELFEVQIAPVIKNSLEVLKGKGFEKFYREKTTEDFRKTVDITALQELYNAFPLFSQFSRIDVSNYSHSGDLYFLDMKLVKGSESMVVEFVVEKEANLWKISGIKVFEQDSAH